MKKFFLIFVVLSFFEVKAERIKDIANISGQRSNQLMGYGLVVGLDGSGDSNSPFTDQVIRNMFSRSGISVSPGSKVVSKNVAGVVVTANLPAFPSPGMSIDINVSVLGDAKSLRGGTLLVTPLYGVDGEIYALAQGNVIVGGAGASSGGNSTVKNQLNAGIIPSGATVERSLPSVLSNGSQFVRVELNKADFASADNVVQAINRRFGQGTARALDGRVIEVKTPLDTNERVMFLARLQEVETSVGVERPVVTINARTGTVVMTSNVKLEPFAISHGNLTVTIKSTEQTSQPELAATDNPIQADGTAAIRTQKDNIVSLEVESEKGNVINVSRAANLSDVVKALNSIGATPQDLLSILQAMKAAGALKADINVI